MNKPETMKMSELVGPVLHEKECTRCHKPKPINQYTWIKARRVAHVWCKQCRCNHAREKKLSEKVYSRKVCVDDDLYNQTMSLWG